MAEDNLGFMHKVCVYWHQVFQLCTIRFGRVYLWNWDWGTSLLKYGKDCLQCRRPRSDPWVRKIQWRKEWQPIPLFLPGETHGQRSLVTLFMGSQRVGHDRATIYHYHSLSQDHDHDPWQMLTALKEHKLIRKCREEVGSRPQARTWVTVDITKLLCCAY